MWIRTRIAIQGAGLPCKLESIQTKCTSMDVDNMWFVTERMGAAPFWKAMAKAAKHKLMLLMRERLLHLFVYRQNKLAR